MTHPKKLKIQVRGISTPGIKITARERKVYICSGCSNRYYAFHYFCPQCLGYTRNAASMLCTLRLLSFPAEKQQSLIDLMKVLSGQPAFDFHRALRSLPWIIFERGDPAILEEWKLALETEQAQLEITPIEETSRSTKTKKAMRLVPGDAPLPRFLGPKMDPAVREIAKHIHDSSVRLLWCEIVLMAFRIVESFYKQDPAGRLLFSDLIFKIEEDLLLAIREYNGYYKYHEVEFAEVLEGIQSSIGEKHSEIREIKDQVRQRL